MAVFRTRKYDEDVDGDAGLQHQMRMKWAEMKLWDQAKEMNGCILDWSQHESPAKTEDDASNEIFIIFFYKAFYFFSHSLIHTHTRSSSHSILCYAIMLMNEMYNYRLYSSSLSLCLCPSGMWDVWCLCYVFRALVFKYMTLIKITNDDDQLLVLNCFSFSPFLLSIFFYLYRLRSWRSHHMTYCTEYYGNCPMNDSRCFGYKYDMAYEIDNRILDTIE